MTKPSPFSKQSGNTLLGLMLGLIIGLAVAIIIALYISHAPRPVSSRNEMAPETDSDRSASELNRPLQGLSPGQPMAPQSEPSEEAAQIIEVTVPQPDEVHAPDQVLPVQQEKTASAPKNKQYYLQIGAYKTLDDADQQRAQLALQGLEAKVTRVDRDGSRYYRVRLGPYAKPEQMGATRKRLSEAGINATVVH
jgi:cell division protein FtsN